MLKKQTKPKQQQQQPKTHLIAMKSQETAFYLHSKMHQYDQPLKNILDHQRFLVAGGGLGVFRNVRKCCFYSSVLVMILFTEHKNLPTCFLDTEMSPSLEVNFSQEHTDGYWMKKKD